MNPEFDAVAPNGPTAETTVADDAIKVTGGILREGGKGCPRRLALILADRQGTRTGGGRYRVSQRLTNDVRLAHAIMRTPRESDFPTPTDLLPEEQRLYAAAATGYLTLFGERPARAIDIDDFETYIPGVRLVGPVGVVVETEAGNVEARNLRFGTRLKEPGEPEIEFAALRIRFPRFTMINADLLRLDSVATDVDVSTDDMLEQWATGEARRLLNVSDERRPISGNECGWCAYIADCEAHRE